MHTLAPEGCETKAKACKDCSCGRAEVLIAEALTEKNGTDAVVKPLSNCNKVYALSMMDLLCMLTTEF